MSYIVTLKNKFKCDHLKAIADDGVHGILNCKFPKDILGISRYDFRNEGIQFEVSKLNYDDANDFYRVSKKDVIRIIPNNSSINNDQDEIISDNNTLSTNDLDITDTEMDNNSTSTIDGQSLKKVNKNKFNYAEDDDLDEDFEDQLIHRAHFSRAADPYDSEPDPEKRKRVDNVLKIPAFLALKLYEATIKHWFDASNPDNKIKELDAEPIILVQSQPYVDPITNKMVYNAEGIHRKDILKMAGLANYDTKLEQNSTFRDFEAAGIAYINPAKDPNCDNCIFPGPNLEKFINGNITLADNAYEYKGKSVIDPLTGKKTKNLAPFEYDDDFSNEIGTVKNRKIFKDACAAKTTLPGRDALFDFLPSIVIIDPKKSIDSQIKNADAAVDSDELSANSPVYQTAGVKKVNKSKFSYADDDDDEDDQEMKAESLEEYTQLLKEEYCKRCGLDPTKDLSAKDYSDFQFSKLCCEHNAFYDVYRPRIFGEINYE